MLYFDYPERVNKDLLAGKITSAEELTKALGQRVNSSFPVAGETQPFSWWGLREAARFATDIYTTSAVLTGINQNHPGYFVHVSREDKQMVAYTPAREAGESDKQLRTTLGKFLVKAFPMLTDSYIQGLVNEHEAEVNAVIEWIDGGHDIAQAYIESGAGGSGISACMSKGDDRFEARSHPCVVYDHPDIRMAVLRDSNRKLIARSLTYKKQWIRCYPGAPSRLSAMLEREGYVKGTWVGATLKAVPSQKDGYYLMPYLDGNGTRASASYSTIALFPEGIRVVSEEEQRLLTNTGGNFVQASSTEGHVFLHMNKSDIFIMEDVITGEKLDLREFRGVATVAVNILGRSGRSLQSNLEAYLAQPTTPEHPELKWVRDCWTDTFFTHGFTAYADNETNRHRWGYRKLSAVYYPDMQDWVRDRTFADLGFDENTGLHLGHILASDAAIVLQPAGSTWNRRFVHKTVIDKTYVKVHSPTRLGPNVYVSAAHKDKIKVTSTGRKVLPGFHAVRELWNGKWAFTKNLNYVHVAGQTFYYEGDTAPAELAVGGAWWKATALELMDEMYRGMSNLSTQEKVSNAFLFYTSDNSFYLYDSVSRERLRSGRDWSRIVGGPGRETVLAVIRQWLAEHSAELDSPVIQVALQWLDSLGVVGTTVPDEAAIQAVLAVRPPAPDLHALASPVAPVVHHVPLPVPQAEVFTAVMEDEL